MNIVLRKRNTSNYIIFRNKSELYKYYFDDCIKTGGEVVAEPYDSIKKILEELPYAEYDYIINAKSKKEIIKNAMARDFYDYSYWI